MCIFGTEKNKKMKSGTVSFVFVFLFTTAVLEIGCTTSIMESNGTAAEDIDGKMLLNLGRQLNNPMLTLVAMMIRNLESLHPCDDWTKWSECGTVRRGYIATRKRTRSCVTSSSSQEHQNKTMETDISVCEGFCPMDYNMTANGFCVKLYRNSKSFADVKKKCKTDGGHVINIDSELKYGDVKTVIKGMSTYVFIDGQRKDSSSPWLLENGSQKKFFKWASGQPDNYLCMIMHYSDYNWYDYRCTSVKPFLCEIVQSE